MLATKSINAYLLKNTITMERPRPTNDLGGKQNSYYINTFQMKEMNKNIDNENEAISAKKKSETSKVYTANPELLKMEHRLLLNRGEVIVRGVRFKFSDKRLGKTLPSYKVDWKKTIN